VLPESEGPATVLAGETPDPSRVPSGCRFHPRCPLLAAGLPDSVADRCRTVDLPIVDGSAAGVACHAVEVAAAGR
jgi:ABC-type dipeptide/oligopeptide/nickel transport system ATPase component